MTIEQDELNWLRKEYGKVSNENHLLKDKVDSLKAFLMIAVIAAVIFLVYPHIRIGGYTRDIQTDCDNMGCQSY